jgi:hypothetical protein
MFNKKNYDPLVDSVKAVMEQNEFLRRVEAQVNEQFGVASKNALPHELHAKYDAVLAEAKKCAMYEEEKEDAPATPEHHRAEAIRLHKAIKAGNKTPVNVAKKKQHEKEYKKMTGNKIKYPESIDEKYSPKQQKFAMLGNVSGHGGDPEKIDKQDLKAARGGHAHKVGLEEKQDDKASKIISHEMKKFKAGELHSGKKGPGKGPVVKSREQAVAIALDVARRKGANVSPKKSDSKESGVMKEDIQSLLEEIRTNLEEEMAYIFENYDEATFADYVNSLTEEQLAILGLVEQQEPKPGFGRGLPPSALRTYKPSREPAAQTQRVDGTMGRTAQQPSTSVRPTDAQSAAAKAQAQRENQMAAATAAAKAKPQSTVMGGGAGVSPTAPKGGALTASSTQAKAPATPAIKKAQPAQNRAATPTAKPAQRPMAPARKPGQIAAAVQKRIGYTTAKAGTTPGELMSMRESNESPVQIKESFEQFLRNKFLKG